MASSGDDFSLSRVSKDARRPMWQVLVIRIGSLACVSQLMLGAALGYGMSFWGGFLGDHVRKCFTTSRELGYRCCSCQ